MATLSCRAALNADPTGWLVEAENPVVRRLTLTQVLGLGEGDPEVRAATDALWGYPPVQRLLATLQRDPWDLDNLVRFGVPANHPAVGAACERWLARPMRTEDGARHATVPHTICYFDQVVGGLIRCGYEDDPRLRERIRYVLEHNPLYDGNRPGTRLRYGGRGNCFGAHTCYTVPVRALWAIAGVPEERRTPDMRAFLETGARFLRAHRLYQSNHRGFRPINAGWLKLHLPFALGWHTDVLDILDVATQVGLAGDACAADALRLLLDKQNERGRWSVEASYSGHYDGLLGTAVKDVEAVGQESRWITLAALVQLQRCERLVLRLCRGASIEAPKELPEAPFADYPLYDDPDDEARVRREWSALGMSADLDGLLGFARAHGLRAGWRWGLVLGPEDCREWCAAAVRHVPARNIKAAWPVARICFLARAGRLTAERVSQRLGIPLRDDPPPGVKRANWIENTLWRVGVEPWRAGWDEVGVVIRHPEELVRLLPLMEEALGEMNG